jgi:DNA-directed RNA polymerase sigma subunit (sigma70/sigma32)
MKDKIIHVPRMIETVSRKLKNGNTSDVSIGRDTMKYVKMADEVIDVASLDKAVGEGDKVLGDFIPDDRNSVEKEVFDNLVHPQVISEIQKRLTEEEAMIVFARFGLLGDEPAMCKNIMPDSYNDRQIEWILKTAVGRLKTKEIIELLTP